jgi:uncharacterized protein (TIGR02246 family)
MMRNIAILAAVLLLTVPAAVVAAEAEKRPEDEKAIRQAAAAFAKAYNSHDAKALAGLFATDGEIVNEAGESSQGRNAIEQTFAAIFQKHPHAQISIGVESIRFIAPPLAIEDGATTVRGLSGEAPAEHNRYTVVHVKQDGQWLMASARDLPDEEASATEQIKQLEWLIGEWVHETPDSLVVTSYRWNPTHTAILSDFRIQVGGQPAMTGTQRIGWNPARKKIHSWLFDSEGGGAEVVWTRDGDRWVNKSTGTTHDGRAVSATHVMVKTGKDRMTWESRDRVVGDEVQPDIKAITIVRKPPLPGRPTLNTTGHGKGETQ